MKILSKIFVLVFCALAAGPFVLHLLSSLKDPIEIGRIPPTIFISRPTLENYFSLFEQRPFLRYCMNSFVIASLSSLLCVASASPAAYRLARLGEKTRVGVSSLLLVLA